MLRLGGSWFKTSQANSSRDPISKNDQRKMEWSCGSSDRVPSLQVRSSKFKSQFHHKKKKKEERKKKILKAVRDTTIPIEKYLVNNRKLLSYHGRQKKIDMFLSNDEKCKTLSQVTYVAFSETIFQL
jgi:hypothetical protein